MRQPIIAGNWKMHGFHLQSQELVQSVLDNTVEISSNIDILLCPPVLYIEQVISYVANTPIKVGAQNAWYAEQGAFTGEISVSMLDDVGCDYIILGHSERRQLFSETDELVALKAQAACRGQVKPIICVGETLAERKDGCTMDVVARQLLAVLDKISPQEFAGSVVAYEPIWAIGTGEVATPVQAQQVHRYLRDVLRQYDASVADSTRIIYGGSVKPGNAAGLFAQADIDGGLVGGAALIATDFVEICNLAHEANK